MAHGNEVPEKRASSREEQQRRADSTASILDRPYVRIARPGVLGSSGYRSHRRTLREVLLIGLLRTEKERVEKISSYLSQTP